MEDIETILDTLIYDRKVEKSVLASQSSGKEGSGHVNVYRILEPLVSSASLVKIPCGVCPVSKRYS